MFDAKKLKILYEISHTACDYEIIHNCPDDFSFYGIGGVNDEWNCYERPWPNHLMEVVSSIKGDYDLAVVTSEKLFSELPSSIPKIWKCLWDFGEVRLPPKIIDSIVAWVAPCRETANHWHLSNNPKTRIVEHGINADVFCSWQGNIPRTLAVGNRVMRRPDKFPAILKKIAVEILLDLVGDDNDDFFPANRLGYLGMKDTAEQYRQHRVYFNPSIVIGCATLEAMATGCPVVTMKPDNFVDFMQDGVNCFVAENTDKAISIIQQLMKDDDLCRTIGSNARKMAQQRFNPKRCGDEWGQVIKSVAL